MVRIAKLTDYGVLIMAYMANSIKKNKDKDIGECDNKLDNGAALLNTSGLRLFQAREIAEHTSISLTTVSKLLKILTKHKLLMSHRGVHGGYSLARAPDSISVADLIQALEGPLAITECNLGHDYCPTQSQCAVRAPWQHINRVITEALASVKLTELMPLEHRPPVEILSDENLGVKNLAMTEMKERNLFPLTISMRI